MSMEDNDSFTLICKEEMIVIGRANIFMLNTLFLLRKDVVSTIT